MPFHALRISFLTLLAGSATLLAAAPLTAQSLYTGLALAADGDSDEVAFRPAPEHDIPPPPGLERMSVSQALQDHLVGWIGGEQAAVVSGVRVHGYYVSRGRVVQRFGTGEEYQGSLRVRDGWYFEEEEEMQVIPARRFLSEDFLRSEVAEQRVRGYELSTEMVPLEQLQKRPGEFVANGIFDSPRERRMGDVLMLVLTPADQELSQRSEGTVMLVMF